MSIKMLEGVTLRSITGMHRGSGEIVFTAEDGRRWRMLHHQDCCESVELEDACGDVEDLIGTPITVAEERSMAGPSRYESSTWTFYELATNRGSMTLRWLGVSNGYYGEGVSFEEISHHDLAREGKLVDGVYEVETADGREWWLWDQESWRDFSGEVLDTWTASRRFTVLGPALRRPE
jgi:hypothetical protein